MESVTKVTVVIPTALWEDVKRLTPAGKRSQLVSEALQAELRRRQRLVQLEQLRQFQDYMRDKYGELPGAAAEIAEMRQERDDANTAVR